MESMIDWVEKNALENIRFHLNAADILAEESKTTLNLLLAGIGATMAHSMLGLEAQIMTNSHTASTVLAVYFAVVSALLIHNCMKITPIPSPTNEPKNLYSTKFSLEEIKISELDNIQTRIEQSVKRNNSIARWLNIIRILAVVSPIVWAAAFYFFRFLSSN